jgi:hypothetical protein
MSGFEIAGIVLAVIPIIYDALKDAPETGIGKQGSAFRKAARRRREFALKLFLLDTELRNSMLDIFKWVKLPLTDVQWDHLMSKRTMGAKLLQIWNDLLETLPQEMNTAFKSALEEIRDVLESIEEILVAIVVHTHISYDEGRQKLRSIAKDKNDCTLAMKGHIKDRFNFAKSSADRDALVKEMTENIKLLKLTLETHQKTADLAETRYATKCRKLHCPFLEQVRRYSDNLYDALSESWNCICHKSRSAMLRLEKRDSPDERKPTDIRFSLILTFEHSSGEPEVDSWAFRETGVCVNTK